MNSTFRYKNNTIPEDGLENKPLNIAADASSLKIKTLKDIQSLPTNHKYQILSESIQYLNHLDTSLSIKEYIESAKKVLEYLVKVIPEDHELYYEIWTKYFAIANKKFSLATTEEDKQLFKTSHANFISSIMHHNADSQSSQSQSSKSTDWRIVKKMRQLEGKIIVSSAGNDKERDIEVLVSEFKKKVEEAKEMLFWNFEQSRLIQFSKKILIHLFEFVSKEENKEAVVKAILEGRFDKSIFGDSANNINHTLILGENGGLYVLLNSLADENLQILKDVVGEEYLSDKIKKNDKNINKIIIGKGAFGTVKFAISLFLTEHTVPGKVICIKKTHSIKKFNDTKRGQIAFSAVDQITDLTIGDYYASSNEISKLIFSPLVLDLALIILKKYNTKSEHMKGYLMMELIPQNTGTSIFLKNSHHLKLDWVTDIKPYLLEVFSKTQELLDQNIAMTDLKPDNTLYDIDNRKAYIIDLGGSLKIEEGIKQFRLNDHSFQFTAEFSAPEIIKPEKDVIDVGLSLAFTCGLIVNRVKDAISSKLFGNDLALTTNKITDLVQQLNDLGTKMTKKAPEERISIPQAIEAIKKIGDDKLKNAKLFSRYIDKLRKRLNEDRASISINEDIYQVRQVLLPSKLTKSDPEIDQLQDTEDLTKKVEEFISADPSKSEKSLLLLLGGAGSGKSINLQIEFIKTVESWNEKKPLPIYFNLANGTDISETLQKLDLQLNTTLYDLLISDKSTSKSLTIFVDSFDEGIYKDDSEKENLISSYFKAFQSSAELNVKLVVSCRTDFLKIDSRNYQRYENWFKGQDSKFTQFFIAPTNYKKLDNNCEDLLNNYFKSEKNEKKKKSIVDSYLKKIRSVELEQYLTTGFIFSMVMKIYEQSDEKIQIRDLIDIYYHYVKIYIKNSLEDPKTTEKIELITQKWAHSNREGDSTQFDLEKFLYKVGLHIAELLFIEKAFRIKNKENRSGEKKLDQSIFTIFGHKDNPKIGLRNQEFFYILKNLPLKVEIKKVNSSPEQTGKSTEYEDVAIGFVHDTVKNYFLFEALKEEAELMMNTNESSRILGCRYLTEDSEFLRFMGQAIKQNPETYELLTNYLRKQIELTKTIKNNDSLVISSANSMTLLVAAGYTFSGQDLTNTTIKGAILNNGIFTSVDFTGSDLSYCSFKDARITSSRFLKTNMKGVKLSIQPELSGHKMGVLCITYSPDGRFLATGGGEDLCKIWDATSGREMMSLKGHKSEVYSVSYSPDGKNIATASSDTTCKIWDTATGNVIRTLEGHKKIVVSIAYSPDGKYLASTSYDCTCKIWEASTGKNLKTLEGYELTVTCAVFSPDGKYLATSSWEEKCKIWDVSSGNEVLVLEGHTSGVKTLAYSPDGAFIASCSDDKTCKIWNAASGKEVLTLQGHEDQVTSIAYSPNGKYVASSSDDKTCKIWDTSSGRLLQTLLGHIDKVTCVTYSPDGRYIATSSGKDDKTCKVWDASPEKQLQIFQGHNNTVYCVTFSPDGKQLASCSGYDENCGKIWDLKSGKQLHILQGHTAELLWGVYSPDGKYFATCSADKTGRVWDVTTGKQVQILQGHSDGINSIDYSPDGKFLATASEDNTCKIWDSASGKNFKTLKGHTSFLNFVKYSPNGNYIATGAFDSKVKIWDPTLGKLIKSLEGHRESTISAAFSPDGKLLVSTSTDKSFKIWDTSTWEELKTVWLNNKSIKHIVFSPDGKRFAGSCDDGTFQRWDASSHKELQNVKGHSESAYCINYSPDGKLLATSSFDHTFKIWEASPGEQAEQAPNSTESQVPQGNQKQGHLDKIRCVKYSPDGKLIATASDDKTCKIWDSNTCQELLTLQGHYLTVKTCAFSADGKQIVTSSFDSSCRVWDASTGQSIRILRALSWSVTCSPDGKYLATSSNITDKVFKIWDFSTGDELFSILKHTGNVTCVSYSKDSKFLATSSGYADKSCRIWDSSKYEEVKKLEGHSSQVTCIEFSPDGKMLATGSGDKTCKIWDADTGKEIRTISDHSEIVTCVKFSPDGNLLVSTSEDKTCRIWEVSSGKLINNLQEHTDAVTWVDYHPDGKSFTTCSEDKTCIIWDPATGRQLNTLPSTMTNNKISKLSSSIRLVREFSVTNPKIDATEAIFEECDINTENMFILKQKGASVIETKQKLLAETDSLGLDNRSKYQIKLPKETRKKYLEEKSEKFAKFVGPTNKNDQLMSKLQKIYSKVTHDSQVIQSNYGQTASQNSNNQKNERKAHQSVCCSIF